MKFWKRQTPPEAKLPRFHPQTILRDWGNGDAFRLADAQTGVFAVGATGSGKTSGPGKHLAFGFLANEMGGLVLCAKKDECRQWQQWAAETGRTDDLVIIDASGRWRFNFMNWEASRPEEGGGLSINIVNLLDELSTAISGAEQDSGGTSRFFEQAAGHMNTNLVELPLLAGLEVTLPLLWSIVTSAPLTPEQVNSPAWKASSACAAIVAEADKATANGDAEARADFEKCRDYWMQDYPNLSEKTRSIITLVFSMLVRPLITRPLSRVFTTDTNVRPEDTFDGKIIIVDIPVQEYRLVGRIANLAWKYCFQIAVLRRTQPKDGYLRSTFLWADEAQNFVSKFDSEYQAVARSAGGCTVYLTQNIESFRRVLKNNDAVDSLLGNLQAKFFTQNSGDTNEWASKLLGQRWLQVNSTSVGQSSKEMALTTQNQGNFNSGLSRSEQRRYFVEPATFTTLKRGGPQHGFQVEAIVYNGGHIFYDGNEPLPYKKITFNQK
jgi:hypothetical protein